VKSVAAFATFRAGKDEPDFVVVVRGNFPADLVDKVAVQTKGKTDKVDGRTVLALEDGVSMSSGADGSLLVGATGWVKARAATAWKPVKGKKGALVARVGATVDEKPWFVVASSPGAGLRKMIDKETAGDAEAKAAAGLIVDHQFAALAMTWNGVGWTYVAKDNAGFERAGLASEGILSLMRAGHLATRGLFQLFLAAADGVPQLKGVAKHRDDLLKLMEQWTGDGMFKATVDRQKKDKTVVVKATGSRLSEVVPVAAAALPAAGLLLFTGGMKKVESKGMRHVEAVEKAEEPKPVKKKAPK
jgi:hypothetical protein